MPTLKKEVLVMSIMCHVGEDPSNFLEWYVLHFRVHYDDSTEPQLFAGLALSL